MFQELCIFGLKTWLTLSSHNRFWVMQPKFEKEQKETAAARLVLEVGE